MQDIQSIYMYLESGDNLRLCLAGRKANRNECKMSNLGEENGKDTDDLSLVVLDVDSSLF